MEACAEKMEEMSRASLAFDSLPRASTCCNCFNGSAQAMAECDMAPIELPPRSWSDSISQAWATSASVFETLFSSRPVVALAWHNPTKSTSHVRDFSELNR